MLDSGMGRGLVSTGGRSQSLVTLGMKSVGPGPGAEDEESFLRLTVMVLYWVCVLRTVVVVVGSAEAGTSLQSQQSCS
jgi:hypothetical protein